MQFFYSLVTGSQVVVFNANIKKFSIEKLAAGIAQHKITTDIFPPSQVINFLKKDYKCELSSLKRVLCGGAVLPDNIAEKFVEKYDLEDFLQGYSMTEMTGITTLEHYGSKNYESVGVPIALIQIKVVDLETGQPLVANQKGEIWLRGLGAFKGYYGNEEETKSISTDGWIHSGDIGYFDLDRKFYIIDRLKDIIKCDGHSMAAVEVESLLLSHEAVLEAAVVGMPHEISGELPTAYVILKEQYSNGKINEKELLEFADGKIM